MGEGEELLWWTCSDDLDVAGLCPQFEGWVLRPAHPNHVLHAWALCCAEGHHVQVRQHRGVVIRAREQGHHCVHRQQVFHGHSNHCAKPEAPSDTGHAVQTSKQKLTGVLQGKEEREGGGREVHRVREKGEEDHRVREKARVGGGW